MYCSGEEGGFFLGLSYDRVVRAHKNHNMVFKLESLCNVQSLRFYNPSVPWLTFSATYRNHVR